jgi:hypothetical protein
MAEPLADGGVAHARVDELRRVGVAQLMQGGVDAGGSRVPDPTILVCNATIRGEQGENSIQHT